MHAPIRLRHKLILITLEIREELKPETLSFTAIAKRVGERWQEISAEEKEPYESGAAAAKEKYHAQMTEYKTTKAYRDYQQYLAEFEAKHASSSGVYQNRRPDLLLLTYDQMGNAQSSRQKRPMEVQLAAGV